jgi:hypothetical protein
MPGYQLSELIHRSPPEVFDFVATHQVENHPRWEPEVLSIRQVTEGPLRAGFQAVMVRQDFGRRRREIPYEVIAFERERIMTLRSVEKSMTFEITFQFAPAGPAATNLGVAVRIQPQGLLKPLGPALALLFRRNGIRLTRRLRNLVEASH